MYYEEKMIDGVMHYRTDPKGEFKPYTLESISSRYDGLKTDIREVRKQFMNERISNLCDNLEREPWVVQFLEQSMIHKVLDLIK